MLKLKKKNYRQHAHSNPFNDYFKYPKSPLEINWNDIYGTKQNSGPDFLDLGCGYGSFLIFLSKMYPEKLVIGMEIRNKVYNYVKKKIDNLKSTKELGNNCAIVQSNALFFYLNYFQKFQLEKIFCLFPDPHFKKKKQKARIICKPMLDQFAFTLKIGGRIYVSTDVEELFESMIKSLDEHRLFSKVDSDILFKYISTETDESRRAGKKAGKVFAAIYERIDK